MSYTKTNWQDLPSTSTPLNSTNLNHIEQGIYTNDSNIASNTSNIADLTTALNNLNTYSTNETQIGTWINGKPIYRKVININALPDNTYSNTPHEISNLSEVVKTSAIMKNSVDPLFAPLNLQGTSAIFSNNTIVYRITTTNIVISTTSNYSGYSASVIIEYTKTTD